MSETGSGEDERWLVVNGRRWRRTDPVLDLDTLRPRAASGYSTNAEVAPIAVFALTE